MPCNKQKFFFEIMFMNMKLRSFEKLPMEILFNHIPPARLTVWLINAHIIVYSRNCVIRLDVWFVVLIYVTCRNSFKVVKKRRFYIGLKHFYRQLPYFKAVTYIVNSIHIRRKIRTVDVTLESPTTKLFMLLLLKRFDFLM